MEAALMYALNGLSFGMVLFLVASGLTLTFGVMGILNLAHGSSYLVGAYVGLAALKYVGSFPVGVAAGALATGMIGMLVYRLLLMQLYQEHLAQVLLTFGLLFFFADVCLWIWGGMPRVLPKPAILTGSLQIGSSAFSVYRLFIILISCAVAIGLWWFQQKTRFGALVRAAADDQEMTGGVGINFPLVCSAVFALGSVIAGAGGVLGAGFLGVYPGIDFEILTDALIVIIIGGVGSLRGAFVASIMVGILDNLGRAFFPEASMFTLFLCMGIFLVVKPEGLWGKR